MPAAKPSKAQVSNAIEAVLEADLLPQSIHVSPEGSIDIVLVDPKRSMQCKTALKNDEGLKAPSWDEVHEDCH